MIKYKRLRTLKTNKRSLIVSHNKNAPDLSSDIAKTLLGILSVIIFIAVLISLGRLGTAYGVFTSVFTWSHVSLGLDSYPAVAVSSILTGVILLCIPYAIWFFLFGKKRQNAIILIAGSTALIAIITHVVGKNVRFDRTTGEAMKFYADTPDGRIVSESPGYDPKYGVKYQPYTPKAAAEERGPSKESIQYAHDLENAKERAREEALVQITVENLNIS